MFILLIPITFILLICNQEFKTDTNLKETILKSVIVLALILFGITEMLSFFNVLNPTLIILSWSLIAGALPGRIFFKEELSFTPVKTLWTTLSGLRKKRGRFFTVSIILGLTLLQGLAYPPNNWDSMTYHLARVTNWLSHQSLEHYATHIPRQLYQPPFAEFVSLHAEALTSSDLFVNAIQFSFWLSCVVVILLLIEELGIAAIQKVKYVAVILVLTIPEAILQSSSTQNDIVVSFFILAALYFGIKILKKFSFSSFMFLGVSIGLAVLTKGLAYVYLTPLLVVFAIVYLIRLSKSFSWKRIYYPLLAGVVCLLINAGHYSRNFSLTGNVLGIEEQESGLYFTEDMTPKLFLSNTLKNAGLQMGPYPINIIYDKAIAKIHSALDTDINSPNTSFVNSTYSGSGDFPNDEDTASNPLHFWLILCVLVILVVQLIRFRKNSRPPDYGTFLFVIFLLQLFLFCLLLKWQPWGTRLQLPLFFVAIPLVVYALSLKRKYLKRIYFMLPTFVFYGFLVILFNFSRPLLTTSKTAGISIFDSRSKKYFAKKPFLYEEYAQMSDYIETSSSVKVGIIVGADDWEYPLFNAFHHSGAVPVHIYMSNYTNELLTGGDIDCVVSTSVNTEYIGYNGREYINQTANNQHVWFYR